MGPETLQYLWIPVLIALLLGLAAFVRTLGSRGSERSDRQSQEQLNRRLEELDRISSRLDDLRTVFVTPHIRGGVGETLLEELIRNWLPSKAYSFQYGFHNGSRADAIIRLGSYMVAVDSKFPLESVQELFKSEQFEAEGGDRASDERLPSSIRRSLVSHAKEISSKYIRPEEGTLQFAIMYIPSESVYYRCFVRESGIAEELLSLNVVPAGPYSLFLYIQTIAYGLRGFAFPERSREVAELSYRLDSEIEMLAKELGTAGTHLKNLVAVFEQLDKRSRRLRSVAEGLSRT